MSGGGPAGAPAVPPKPSESCTEGEEARGDEAAGRQQVQCCAVLLEQVEEAAGMQQGYINDVQASRQRATADNVPELGLWRCGCSERQQIKQRTCVTFVIAQPASKGIQLLCLVLQYFVQHFNQRQ